MQRRLTSPDLLGPPAVVRRVEPLVALPPRVAPAVLIGDADAGIGRDGELGVSKPLTNAESKAGYSLVRIVHAG